MSNKPHAVILDLNFSGYGIVRSLHSFGIPIIGFYNDKNRPESRTKLCNKKIYFSDNEELLELLISLPELKNEKPILYLTADVFVTFFIKNRQVLEKLYNIDIPDDDTVDMLLDKNKFSEFANKNNILIPKTARLYGNQSDLEEVKNNFEFPVILKPFLRKANWKEANMPKAFLLEEYNEFKKVYNKAISVEKELIIQEWIPGKDFNIFYNLNYFTRDSESIASFTGYKIRQWPVGTGSTATTTIADNEFITNETERIFKKVGFMGFGSIEYKKHDRNNKYYVMEPTVGRLNQQEYVATLNNTNIPLIVYNYFTNELIKDSTPKKNNKVIYIDGPGEIASTLVHFKRKLLTPRQWLLSLKGKRAYRYFYRRDISVFMGLGRKMLFEIKKKIF